MRGGEMALLETTMRRVVSLVRVLRQEAAIPIGYRLDQTRSYPTVQQFS